MEIDLDEILGEYKPFYDSRKSSNFMHILRNDIMHFMTANELGKEEECKEVIDRIKTYIGLLNEFSDFRQRELFSETPDCTYPVNYINAQYSRLKAK